MLDIRDPVSRVSLDTFYQVSFSFGNEDKWFKQSVSSGSKRAAGTGFKQKMSLLCTQAEIPGTSYLTTQAVGHHQGIQEVFPTLRQFPPLNLTFYVDADHLILEILESWMTYINPVSDRKRLDAYGRLNYPETYKERLHVSKFERDTFLEGNNSDGSPKGTSLRRSSLSSSAGNTCAQPFGDIPVLTHSRSSGHNERSTMRSSV